MTGWVSFTGRLVSLMALAGNLVLAAPAAHAQDGAVCAFTVDNGRISPGLTATTSKGLWSAGPMAYDCHGTISGRRVTGPGTIVESGPLKGTCSQGSGTGVQTITIPTAEGLLALNLPIAFSWVGAGGTFTAPGVKGAFEFVPTEGNCVTAPVTAYRQVTQIFSTS